MKSYQILSLTSLSLALSLLSMPAWTDVGEREAYKGEHTQHLVPPSSARTVLPAPHCVDPNTLVRDFPKQTLSTAEQQALFNLRSEEKFARDLYNALYQRWRLKIFNHIPFNEQRHFATLKSLLDKYQLDDPEMAQKIGQYAQESLNQRYTQWLNQGQQSLMAALQTGALVAEHNIQTLDQNLQNSDNLDVRFALQNLQKGARNHLRSFVGLLHTHGGTYTAQFLPQNELDSLSRTPTESRMVYDDAGEFVLLCGQLGQERPSAQGQPAAPQTPPNMNAKTSGHKIELHGYIRSLNGDTATLEVRQKRDKTPNTVYVNLTHARFEKGYPHINAYVEVEGIMQGEWLQAWEVELEKE